MTVLFDFEGSAEGDLQVYAGDKITVEREEGDWLYCTSSNGTKFGWVPRNFVTESSDNDVVNPNSTNNVDEPVIGRAKALYDFTAENFGEVSISRGMVVGILRKDMIDWWKIKTADDSVGIVPASFLQETAFDGQGGQQLNDDDKFDDSFNQPKGGPHFGYKPSDKSRISDETSGNSVDNDRKTSGVDAVLHKNHFGFSLVASASTEFHSQSNASSATRHSEDAVVTETGLDDEKKRQDAISELITTERSYVEDLAVIVEVY